ncbi:MAG: hypothetical protein ABSC11_03495 [Smithella sp.]|jgi:hypothetical protein
MAKDKNKVSVRSIPKTFCRAGLKFTEQAKNFEVDDKTLKILQAESNLIVGDALPEPDKDPAKKDEK